MSEIDKNAAQAALTAHWIKRGVYRHYKGGEYILYSASCDEATGVHLVHYYSIARLTRWTRNLTHFFGTLRRDDSSPGGGLLAPEPRFTWVRYATDEELIKAAGLGI